MVGAGDVETVDGGSLVLDVAEQAPRVLRLTADARQVAAYDLPQGLQTQDGLTGLALGDRGEILVEREGGAFLSQLVNDQGVMEPVPVPEYSYDGRLFRLQLAGWQTSRGSITAGSNRIEETVPNILAGMRILGVHAGLGWPATRW